MHVVGTGSKLCTAVVTTTQGSWGGGKVIHHRRHWSAALWLLELSVPEAQCLLYSRSHALGHWVLSRLETHHALLVVSATQVKVHRRDAHMIDSQCHMSVAFDAVGCCRNRKRNVCCIHHHIRVVRPALRAVHLNQCGVKAPKIQSTATSHAFAQCST